VSPEPLTIAGNKARQYFDRPPRSSNINPHLRFTTRRLGGPGLTKCTEPHKPFSTQPHRKIAPQTSTDMHSTDPRHPCLLHDTVRDSSSSSSIADYDAHSDFALANSISPFIHLDLPVHFPFLCSFPPLATQKPLLYLLFSPVVSPSHIPVRSSHFPYLTKTLRITFPYKLQQSC
jgi:hypothetical protein